MTCFYLVLFSKSFSKWYPFWGLLRVPKKDISAPTCKYSVYIFRLCFVIFIKFWNRRGLVLRLTFWARLNSAKECLSETRRGLSSGHRLKNTLSPEYCGALLIYLQNTARYVGFFKTISVRSRDAACELLSLSMPAAIGGAASVVEMRRWPWRASI